MQKRDHEFDRLCDKVERYQEQNLKKQEIQEKWNKETSIKVDRIDFNLSELEQRFNYMDASKADLQEFQ